MPCQCQAGQVLARGWGGADLGVLDLLADHEEEVHQDLVLPCVAAAGDDVQVARGVPALEVAGDGIVHSPCLQLGVAQLRPHLRLVHLSAPGFRVTVWAGITSLCNGSPGTACSDAAIAHVWPELWSGLVSSWTPVTLSSPMQALRTALIGCAG